MRAYREQRRIALTCQQKLELVERLLARHARDRVIVFTSDNQTVYDLSRRLLLPVITHQTPTKERREVLTRFNDGTYPVILTSKVLNEGVDVPAANIAIVLSGSGSVREHVQRLGRVLRKQDGKRATLYEVVTRDTVEERVSERRREHDAYR
jgi:superfamily II DNA or RNA helicase